MTPKFDIPPSDAPWTEPTSRPHLRHFVGFLRDERAALCTFVGSFLDRRVRGRIDPSDVVQDTLCDAFQHWERFALLSDDDRRRLLRRVARRRSIDAYRRHIGSSRRSVKCEAHSVSLAPNTVGASPTAAARESDPSSIVGCGELRALVRQAMQDLPPTDREVLVLRDFAQLTVEEVAARLRITPTAVTTRHLRAVGRLRQLLSCHIGDWG